MPHNGRNIHNMTTARKKTIIPSPHGSVGPSSMGGLFGVCVFFVGSALSLAQLRNPDPHAQIRLVPNILAESAFYIIDCKAMRSRALEYHVYICGGGIGMFAGRSPIVCGLEGIARDEEQTANHANKLERIYGECRAGSVEHQQSNPLTLSARAPGFYTGRCTSLARMHFWRIASAKWQKPNRICVVVRAMRFCDFVMTIALRVWCGVWRDSCFAEVEFSLYGVVLWIFFVFLDLECLVWKCARSFVCAEEVYFCWKLRWGMLNMRYSISFVGLFTRVFGLLVGMRNAEAL